MIKHHCSYVLSWIFLSFSEFKHLVRLSVYHNFYNLRDLWLPIITFANKLASESKTRWVQLLWMTTTTTSPWIRKKVSSPTPGCISSNLCATFSLHQKDDLQQVQVDSNGASFAATLKDATHIITNLFKRPTQWTWLTHILMHLLESSRISEKNRINDQIQLLRFWLLNGSHQHERVTGFL